MTRFNFDKETTREGTYSVQYEGTQGIFGKGGLEPFWIADMDIEAPDAIIDSIKRRLDNKIFGYTVWSNPEFFEPIKGWWKKRFNITLEDADINFAQSVLYAVGEAVRQNSSEGDGVILNAPTYNAFIKVFKGNNRKMEPSPLIRNDEGYFFDFEGFEALCKKEENKVFVHCNPHNPTGRVWTREENQKIKDICLANDVFIVSDEIHMDFVRPKESFSSMVELMEDKDPMIVVSGLGKTFNIASLPNSYFITKNQSVKKKINFAADNKYNINTANSLVLAAINAAYTECEEWVDELNEYIDGNLAYVEEYINTHLSDMLSFKKPDSTYLAWVSFEKSGFDEKEVHKALVDVGGIAVSPGYIYDFEESNHFRMNVASSRKRIEDGMKRIHKTFDHLKGTID